jgi:ribosomal RNA-processing protein 9
MQASGAGDGLIRLWGVGESTANHRTLIPKGVIPARGFVNGIAIARDGRFLVGAVGQEPRLGRWVRDKVARNGVLIQNTASRRGVNQRGIVSFRRGSA